MSDDWARAFELAADARAKRDALVASVRSGEVDLHEAHELADADAMTGGVFALKIYEAVPGIGKVRSRRTMAAIGLADDIVLGQVPVEQREEIIRRFAAPASEGQGYPSRP